MGHRWIVAGIGAMIVGSLLAVYFAIGLLFWQGQWQLIFHPSNTVATNPESAGLAFDAIHFAATETGHPQLTGWWIPSDAGGASRHIVVLYVHCERGSLADTIPDLTALHSLGADVFAFDPHGYGKSLWMRPSEQQWQQDAEAALNYLTGTRHVPVREIVPIGRGLGGTVAATLTLAHAELQRFVMIDPQQPVLDRLTAPTWTHILPVRLLAHDRFDPSMALQATGVRKLFLIPPGHRPPGYVLQAAPPATVAQGDVLRGQTATALQIFLDRQ